MELSLDDIIKSKKIGLPPTNAKRFSAKKPLGVRKTIAKPVFKAARVTDARLKIIQKNRAKIRDAREKLAEITRASGDARQKLLRKHANSSLRNGKQSSYRNGSLPTRKVINPIKTKRYREGPSRASARMPEVIDVPRGYVDYDNMERLEEEEFIAATRLSRTVTNDVSPYDTYNSRSEGVSPPAPRRMNSWGSSSEPFDPFDVYQPRDRRMSPELPPPPLKGILRQSSRQLSPEIYHRRYIPESSHLSYEMRTRLERAPDPHASMGIFSNPLKTSPISSNQISPSGYRIVVSNLHSSVTEYDIRELFEDIGELYDSRLVRPGVAEVIYKSLNDAEKAVDTYHNRQLDGQPMKCLLVNPRASNKPTAPALKTSGSSSRLSSGKTPLEIDIDALHKVLFRRH